MDGYQISHRIQAVQQPIIPIVEELIRSIPGTISLGQGVVYYGPPPQALSKLQECSGDNSIHKYGAVHGESWLCETISKKLSAENQVEVNGKNRIVVTAGSNMGFYNAILAIADRGDEIILQSPYYFNHEMAVTMAGCQPVLVNTEADFHWDVAKVARAITGKTKAIVTISPNNPTGAVYSQATLQAINKLCRTYGLYHISDEAYEHFSFDGNRHFSPGSMPDVADYTISLYSLSKSYGFASWRIGYMVIPKHLYEAVRKIQDTILICPPVVSQFAALGAMAEGGSYRDDRIKVIEKVRRIALEKLKDLGQIIATPSAEGAFYILLRVHTDKNDMILLKELITRFHVAAIPGSAFGIHDVCYFRIAYGSLQQATVEEGIDRLVRGLKTLA